MACDGCEIFSYFIEKVVSFSFLSDFLPLSKYDMNETMFTLYLFTEVENKKKEEEKQHQSFI